MDRRTIVGAARAGVLVLMLCASSSARAEVSLGASFGYTHFSYDYSLKVTNNVIGIPGAQGWGQPGIRVGYLAPNEKWDLNIDMGLVHRSGTVGEDETSFQLLPQFQANANRRGGVTPFVNGGLGIQYETVSWGPGSSVSATRPVVGVGLGVRRSVSDGHGLVRIELNYARLFERVKVQSPTAATTFPSTDVFSIKLGFDLLMAREVAPRP